MALKHNPIPPYEEGYQTGDINRAYQMRRDNDTVKTPKVSLYDIDYAILYHLSENLKLKVQEEDRTIDVPVLYADGEKWAQIRSRGFLRDSKDKVLVPMIAVRRTGVTPDDRIPTLDLNNRATQRKFFPYKTMNMQYDRISGQVTRKPSYEFYLVDIPYYVRVTYDLVILTNMIEQMNDIVQGIMTVSDHVWGDFYTFRTSVENATMANTNNSGEDRVVSTTISLQVDGYLLDEFKYQESEIQKAFTIKKVRFENEREEHDFYIEEPSIFFENTHISQEPRHIQLMNKRRNIRYR